MQRIQQLAIRRYHWYTSGEVSYKKALKLVAKFDELYGIHCNENQRTYRRKKGIANAKLFMYLKPNTQVFLWWLLVTDGAGAVHKNEKLHLVYEQRNHLKWHEDYEMVRLNRPGKPKPVLTWRMTKVCYESWFTRMRKAIRSKSDVDVKNTIWSLNRVPGFSELRNQVKKIRKSMHKEWQRSRKGSKVMPHMPAMVPYVRAADTETVLLSTVVSRITKGRAPFPRRNLVLQA